MKYIKYTYVDYKTKKPVSQEPARTGPVTPEGISPVFSIESSYSSGIPVFYGTAEDAYTPEDWMQELTQENFYNTLKSELKQRASKKKKSVEKSGITLADGTFIRSDIESQNRLSTLAASVNNNPDIISVDFEYLPGKWVTVTAEEAINIGNAVSSHVQGCFTWCRGIHERIDAITTLEDAVPIIQDINSHG